MPPPPNADPSPRPELPTEPGEGRKPTPIPPARWIPGKKRPKQLPSGDTDQSTSASSFSSSSDKPADLDHDGNVTDDEESEWMRMQQ